MGWGGARALRWVCPTAPVHRFRLPTPLFGWAHPKSGLGAIAAIAVNSSDGPGGCLGR